jgi:GT2 family glycosyltransferase
VRDDGTTALDVSVIVVTFESEQLIERCLAAVEGAARSHSSEILIVDNASRDSTLTRARASAPGAQVIAFERNVGFAAANNAALEQARGRYRALVNSDAFPDPGAIDRLIERADSNTRIGLVGGRLRDGSGRPQPSAGRFPSLLSELGVALFFHRLPLLWRLPLSVSVNAGCYRAATHVDWVSGAFCLARPEVGPLPAAAFMYGEDVEWSRQARARGLEVWIEPAASAIHLGSGGSASEAAARFRQSSRVDFELRWFAPRGRWALARARLVLAVHALTRIAAFAALVPIRPDRARSGILEFRALLAAALLPGRRSD